MGATGRKHFRWVLGTVLLAAFVIGNLAGADLSPLPPVFEKNTPESVADLRAIQNQVRLILKKVIPCTVGLQIGAAQGSGVIISKDGYVLTAGHVSGAPGRKCVVILSDGRKVEGETLGANVDQDSGLVKITTPGKWPFVDMGKSVSLKKGQWCLAVGHPGGFKQGRPPVVRLGRVQDHGPFIRTDCTLVGGDSGGPLFDMEGKVIGIHSRIGFSLAANLHVPVDTYRDTWDRLAKGEVWGAQPYLGVQLDPDAKDCRILQVFPNSPAAKAGLKARDVLIQFDGKQINTSEQLSKIMNGKRPGNPVSLVVQRGSDTINLRLILGKRPAG